MDRGGGYWNGEGTIVIASVLGRERKHLVFDFSYFCKGASEWRELCRMSDRENEAPRGHTYVYLFLKPPPYKPMQYFMSTYDHRLERSGHLVRRQSLNETAL